MQDAGNQPGGRSGDAELVACSQCGAANPERRKDCWLCHGALGSSKLHGDASVSPANALLPHQPAATQSFSLSTLFLVITLIGVWLGVAAAAPGIGVLLLVAVLPAAVRTFAATGRSKQFGDRPTVGDKLGAFAVSMGIVLLVCVAAFIAFNVACWSLCGLAVVTQSEALIVVSIGGGIVAAVACAGWLLWKTWPR